MRKKWERIKIKKIKKQGIRYLSWQMRKYLIFILLTISLFFKLNAYQVCFEGIPSEEILEVVESSSQLKSEILKAAPSFFTLKKRAESDKKTIIDVMHAFGFYEAAVDVIYWGAFPNTTLRMVIIPGPQYYFGHLNVLDLNGIPIQLPYELLAIKMGCAARSDAILDAEEQILDGLGAAGYPLATITNREVVVDQKSKSVYVTYLIDQGPIAYFGSLCIEGLKKVRSDYILRKVMWKKGDLYNPHLVECTDAYLQETGLFSYIMIQPGDTFDENGLLPMFIHLEEKKFRHIGAGVGYSTDESAGVLLQWSHDNLTGRADSLSLVGEASAVVKRATLFYGMPEFFGRNQDLLYSAETRYERAPGFVEREVSFLIRINRKVNDCFSFNYGGRYERLLSTKSDNNSNYHLLSLPIQLRWDTSNRLLNPIHGTTIAYFGTPHQAILNSQIFFFKQELFAATYHSITRCGGIIMALCAQFGSILGQSTIIVPAPKRFYLGSSTSLRGYKYLSVSPLDQDNKPIGGRAFMVLQVEPRFRVYDKIYLALFFDIGNVYASSLPDWHTKLLRSYGIGMRYLTPVGPFRLDIGFPIDKRRGIDKTFQIYASIGQTF